MFSNLQGLEPMMTKAASKISAVKVSHQIINHLERVFPTHLIAKLV